MMTATSSTNLDLKCFWEAGEVSVLIGMYSAIKFKVIHINFSNYHKSHFILNIQCSIFKSINRYHMHATSSTVNDKTLQITLQDSSCIINYNRIRILPIVRGQ